MKKRISSIKIPFEKKLNERNNCLGHEIYLESISKWDNFVIRVSPGPWPPSPPFTTSPSHTPPPSAPLASASAGAMRTELIANKQKEAK